MDTVWRDNLDKTRQPLKNQVKRRALQESEVQARKVSFFSYMPALLVALLKDIFDPLLGWIPGLGMVVTLCFSLAIFFLLMLAGSSQSYSLSKKGMTLGIQALVESFPLLNFLPIGTVTIMWMYLKDKKLSEKEMSLRA